MRWERRADLYEGFLRLACCLVGRHRRFFALRCAELGVVFSNEVLTVFERFELVWPQRENREP